jgi:hypothetical protein
VAVRSNGCSKIVYIDQAKEGKKGRRKEGKKERRLYI